MSDITQRFFNENFSVGNECQKCKKGEKQELVGQETCEPCDADRGEYQTEEGSPYCKITSPGYQLNKGSTTGMYPRITKCFY